MRSIVVEWSRNKTVNIGFEAVDPDDGSLPSQWLRFDAGSSNVYLDDTDSYSGKYAAAVKTNGTNWLGLEQKLDEYEPNTEYTVTFYGKTDGTYDGRVQAFDYTTVFIA